MKPSEISILDYTYDLPDDRVALHPLEQRDASKLLSYKKGKISEDVFSNIGDHLPEGCLLVFNNTKVINARISFFKSTGARIEVFCLEPYESVNEYVTVMSKTGSVKWKCFVGGAAKWKEERIQKDIVVNGKPVSLYAARSGKEGEAYIVEFSWEPADISFAAILQSAGNVPLPPYIKRTTDDEDVSRYQTIFAEHEGSVAAPTAGIHFTESIFEKLTAKSIQRLFVTLHVGAGTFKPVKAEKMEGHEMHAEYIDVSRGAIEELLCYETVAAVGTTSLRTLESLYWLGVKASLDPSAKQLDIRQWDVYEPRLRDMALPAKDALTALLSWMEENGQSNIFTRTQLLIAPGYRFRIVKILITNFHQPQSTLLLLVAAAIGDDWKKMYAYAMENGFRFLSYGDGNVIEVNGE
ncbi:S-adenosylmethionine:tRNA ribosyltransferase-isomerase [Ferruginibacter sp. HRS2-29]|uniref:S-adenosylmethionine:tRNA ribosyltransferase-isomerase n=1 Tax=Ferruginibacter sp. HRS2-29 TaxID=2487334 RepID=UPI0020CD333C|nr:S-adenosylmethionine:tRNA ribosyltransferase-isomerase [Ferruginibacter sp. HRS2-29]MCP9752670.1 S-adenosylmethionine:tRNA ribosyltransferase-isomerase [Ferruginibacter sp. HRS2-29]